MNLRQLAALSAFCLALLLAVPTQAREELEAVAPPAEDETLIYVIRKGRMLGAAVGHWIAVNDQTVARLRNDKHAIVRAMAGEITLNLANSGVPITPIALDDRGGETVYLKWRLGETELTEIDQKEAAKMLRKTKRMEPLDAPRPNAEQMPVLMNLSRLGFDLMQPASQPAQPDDQHAVITFFRRDDGKDLEFGVWGEHGFVATLGTNEGVRVRIPAGTHFFMAGNVGTSLLQARVEAGKQYYAWVDYGKMMARVRLTPVTAEQSQDLGKWLRDVRYVQLNPAALTARVRSREAKVTEFVRATARRAGAGQADFTLLNSAQGP